MLIFLERFRSFLTLKIDFESQIFALVDNWDLTSSKILWCFSVCWFFAKNLSILHPSQGKLTTKITITLHIAPISQDKVEPFFIHFFYFLHTWRNKQQVLSINFDSKVNRLILGMTYWKPFHDFKPMLVLRSVWLQV